LVTAKSGALKLCQTKLLPATYLVLFVTGPYLLMISYRATSCKHDLLVVKEEMISLLRAGHNRPT